MLRDLLGLALYFDKSGGKVAYNGPKQVMLRIGRRNDVECGVDEVAKYRHAWENTQFESPLNVDYSTYRFKSCLLSNSLENSDKIKTNNLEDRFVFLLVYVINRKTNTYDG